MKLSKIAMLALKGSDKGIKERIAEALGVSLNTVWKWIRDNENNGDLTKVTAVQIISEETGIPVDQILEEVNETEVVSGGKDNI